MEYLTLQKTDLKVSRLIYGCMRLSGDWNNTDSFEVQTERAELVLKKVMDNGFNFFDHADMYAGGKPEQLFGNFLRKNPGLRKSLIVQSKCGICPAGTKDNLVTRYDFSKLHIEQAVLTSLERLQCDYLDILLLHRPDPLMDIYALSEVLEGLYSRGLVRYFGVSNFSASQIELLRSAFGHKIICNQLELSLLHHDFVDEGILVNQQSKKPKLGINDTINYCQQHGVSLQAWGALAQGRLSRAVLSVEHVEHNESITFILELSQKYGLSADAIVLAWLMKHPSKILPIIGTCNLERIDACARATDSIISTDDWYRLFTSVRGNSIP